MKKSLFILLLLVTIVNKAFSYDYDMYPVMNDGLWRYQHIAGTWADVRILEALGYNYEDERKELVIPSGFVDCNFFWKTREIGDNAFSGYDAGSIAFPEIYWIDYKAFYECSELTSLTFPSTLKSIGKYAFAKCYALKSIEIPASVSKIDNCAFMYCDSINEIKVEWEKPIEIGKNAFDYDVLTTAHLYVPRGTIENYTSAEGWKDFLNIEEYDAPTAISSCTLEDEHDDTIYDLLGRRITLTPTKGIYIKNGKKISLLKPSE